MSPFPDKRFDRFTNHAAADAKAGLEIILGRQYRAGRDDFLSDLAAECRQHRVNTARLQTLFGRFGALCAHWICLAPAAGSDGRLAVSSLYTVSSRRRNHPMLNIR